MKPYAIQLKSPLIERPSGGGGGDGAQVGRGEGGAKFMVKSTLTPFTLAPL